jgi:lipopolysaccharide export system permease protein
LAEAVRVGFQAPARTGQPAAKPTPGSRHRRDNLNKLQNTVMSIIGRYLVKETAKFFSVILVTVIFIFLAVDFFEKIDNFIEAGLPLFKILLFFQFRIPFVIAQMAPVGLLLSISIVVGLMNKNNELIALRSSGVSPFVVLRSILAIASACGVLLFILSDQIVPTTISKANRIWYGEVKKKSMVTTEEKNIWIKGYRSITHIRYYNQTSRMMSGVSLYFFDASFRLQRRIDAESGIFRDGKWILKEVMEQKREPNDGDDAYRIRFFPEREEPLEFLPEDLMRAAKKSEEMNFMELLAYIREVEYEGYDASHYRVDLQAKVAFPFVCLILALLAVGIGFKRKAREAISVSIAYGLGVTFLYWIFYSFCLSLGYGGMLPPFVAAWIANFVFFALAVLLLMNVDY